MTGSKNTEDTEAERQTPLATTFPTLLATFFFLLRGL
jgi:hypothetical protein